MNKSKKKCLVDARHFFWTALKKYRQSSTGICLAAGFVVYLQYKSGVDSPETGVMPSALTNQ
ncbi:hypothetical protein [Phnomibacter sp. MR]|uniref:hypothetical protein n=1 Tax=Phnomibacter sp. MR TaxID=3042318 RepID=UPI003A7F8942